MEIEYQERCNGIDDILKQDWIKREGPLCISLSLNHLLTDKEKLQSIDVSYRDSFGRFYALIGISGEILKGECVNYGIRHLSSVTEYLRDILQEIKSLDKEKHFLVRCMLSRASRGIIRDKNIYIVSAYSRFSLREWPSG